MAEPDPVLVALALDAAVRTYGDAVQTVALEELLDAGPPDPIRLRAQIRLRANARQVLLTIVGPHRPDAERLEP